MARVHYYQFLIDSNGSPIENAMINVYAYVLGGSTTSYAYIYSSESSSSPFTTDTNPIYTASNGYFEFWVADKEESSVYGYEYQRQFKITWEKSGYDDGSLTYMQLFDVNNKEVDTASTDTNKNKSISNLLAKQWHDHRTNVALDEHSQYLKTDGSRMLSSDWDIGLSKSISAEHIKARTVGGSLKLTNFGSTGITVMSTGVIEVDNMIINTSVSLPASTLLTSPTIVGGTINGSIIGGITPTAGTFTTLTATDVLSDTVASDTLNATVLLTAAEANIDLVNINNSTISATTSAGLTLSDDGSNIVKIADGGNLGVGLSIPLAKIESRSTSSQLRLSYDNSNYINFTVDSNGDLNIDSVLKTVNETNICLGPDAGFSTATASGCILIGNEAGYTLDEDDVFVVQNSKWRDPLIRADMFNGNISLNGYETTTFSPSATNVLSLYSGSNGVDTLIQDSAQLWVEDINGVSGKTGFHMTAGSTWEPLIVAGVAIKTTTGDPSYVHEGLIVINTTDNVVKIYADGGWRTIASGW